MTIKEEIQIEEYKRTFAEAYKQGFIDAMSVCKTEPITHDDYIESENDYLEARCLNCNNAKACKEKHWDGCVYEPQTDCAWGEPCGK